MRTIWKVQLFPAVEESVELPAGSRIVSVAPDPQSLPGSAQSVAVYIEVETPIPTHSHRAKVYLTGTGHEVPPFDEFIGTVVMPPFAWHVWKQAER